MEYPFSAVDPLFYLCSKATFLAYLFCRASGEELGKSTINFRNLGLEKSHPTGMGQKPATETV